MGKKTKKQGKVFGGKLLSRLGFKMRAKLIVIFMVVKVIPLILLTLIAWRQVAFLGTILKDIAVKDSTVALTDNAIENIERMTTDTALKVAEFLYARDDDITFLSKIEPNTQNYAAFIDSRTGRVIEKGTWKLAGDKRSWIEIILDEPEHRDDEGVSTNSENNDEDRFNYRYAESFEYITIPLYDEITFIDLNGNEIVKVIAEDSPKINYPMNPIRRNVSNKDNTYVKAETYYEKLSELKAGDIYVSDVIGAYVGSNYIGMYTPRILEDVSKLRGYEVPYLPTEQAYAGKENPNGQRFEGIVRWATPVTNEEGEIIGYVTMALNHDHIMEFVDHITPTQDRYTGLPSAFDGNYAFIWDYKCRSICHPRHHSIVGYDAATGDAAIPWLEESIYNAWLDSGVEKWQDFVEDIPEFDEQSRTKKPAAELTNMGMVGLDGRYLNNAPQCTGWMDLTKEGGSGSFFILWSGLYKLTTAAAIPYYTGQYAPSDSNDYSKRGFGFVAIGAGLEDFNSPVTNTEKKLGAAISENLFETTTQLTLTSALLIILVVLIAIWMASSLTDNIKYLIAGISRFRAGERQYRFNSEVKDEFGTLADSFDNMADNVVNSEKNPLCITDLDKKIIYMNEQGLKLCKRSLDEIVGTYFGKYTIYPENSVYCPITAMENSREAEIYYVEDIERYIKGYARYFMSSDNKKLGYIVTSDDVTEMIVEQKKIEEQSTLLNEIFAASPDLIWYENSKGEYLAVNPRFAAIAGKPIEECIGKTAIEVLPPAIAGGFMKNDMEAFYSRTAKYAEEKIEFADKHIEILESVRTPILNTENEVVGLLGFSRNVTNRVTIESELRKTQLELEEAVRDANRANEHKGEFLARMSHEIRTPMNAIIGITNIVLRKMDEQGENRGTKEEVRGHVKQIETSSQHLLGLLNDILDISKIEAGKIELTEEIVDLPKLAATAAGMIKPRCEEKNIAFTISIDEFPNPNVIGDSLRLRQVLINLLGNAVKFTPECGTIEFKVENKERKNGEIYVQFTTKDTGIGIKEEVLEKIFVPFEQGDAGISTQYGGTGLGLTICKRIVELFGGELTVRSKIGEGSEFSFGVWLKETQTNEEETEYSDATNMFTGKRALLVDDVEINRMIVVSLLEETGIEIDEAGDGLMALEMFNESEEDTYDIIFMDIKMPKMGGYEASIAIRELERGDAKKVPIIALTANAFMDDIAKAIQSGMNAHIAKPVEEEKLIEVLFKYVK